MEMRKTRAQSEHEGLVRIPEKTLQIIEIQSRKKGKMLKGCEKMAHLRDSQVCGFEH